MDESASDGIGPRSPAAAIEKIRATTLNSHQPSSSTAASFGEFVGLYDFKQTLGQGHFAVVKLAEHVFTGEQVAVKIIDKLKLDDVSRAHLFHEVRCMKVMNHPHVIKLYEVLDTPSKLYIIMELARDGDMYELVTSKGRFDDKTARLFFRQTLSAIDYCHRLHVVHRDLKPENLLICDSGIKITDFGFSNDYAEGKTMQTACGTLSYSPPELLLGDAYDGPAVDVWSLGVILFMFVTGKLPFEESNPSETLINIMDVKYTVPDHVSSSCRALIGLMLQREPKDRISLANIIRHPWVTDGGRWKEEDALVNNEATSTWINMMVDADRERVFQKLQEIDIDRSTVEASLAVDAYDHVAATFLLLAQQTVTQRLKREQRLRAPLPLAPSRKASNASYHDSSAAVSRETSITAGSSHDARSVSGESGSEAAGEDDNEEDEVVEEVDDSEETNDEDGSSATSDDCAPEPVGHVVLVRTNTITEVDEEEEEEEEDSYAQQRRRRLMTLTSSIPPPALTTTPAVLPPSALPPILMSSMMNGGDVGHHSSTGHERLFWMDESPSPIMQNPEQLGEDDHSNHDRASPTHRHPVRRSQSASSALSMMALSLKRTYTPTKPASVGDETSGLDLPIVTKVQASSTVSGVERRMHTVGLKLSPIVIPPRKTAPTDERRGRNRSASDSRSRARPASYGDPSSSRKNLPELKEHDSILETNSSSSSLDPLSPLISKSFDAPARAATLPSMNFDPNLDRMCVTPDAKIDLRLHFARARAVTMLDQDGNKSGLLTYSEPSSANDLHSFSSTHTGILEQRAQREMKRSTPSEFLKSALTHKQHLSSIQHTPLHQAHQSPEQQNHIHPSHLRHHRTHVTQLTLQSQPNLFSTPVEPNKLISYNPMSQIPDEDDPISHESSSTAPLPSTAPFKLMSPPHRTTGPSPTKASTYQAAVSPQARAGRRGSMPAESARQEMLLRVKNNQAPPTSDYPPVDPISAFTPPPHEVVYTKLERPQSLLPTSPGSPTLTGRMSMWKKHIEERRSSPAAPMQERIRRQRSTTFNEATTSSEFEASNGDIILEQEKPVTKSFASKLLKGINIRRTSSEQLVGDNAKPNTNRLTGHDDDEMNATSL